MSNKIAVLGAGAWGTALACAMAKAGHDVHLWGRDGTVLEEIDQHQKNSKYLGELPLAEGLQVNGNLAQAVAGVVHDGLIPTEGFEKFNDLKKK